MTQFYDTYTNRLDRKGRVSVPAPFRAVLERLGATDLILSPNHKYPCIDARPDTLFRQLAAQLETLDVFSDEHDDLTTTLFARSTSAMPDAEGRITLPERLIAHAKLTDQVTFMGAGASFQLWAPEAAEARLAEAERRTLERRLTVPRRRSAGPA
ncbi:division/cell wall cluster transcriptional repressor MraZ [Elioraea tepida]|jgi:MraZ protein|uniref:Transcriptional regulator MraZ n=1 Tax=Elioraea tepida TaxID=2843330 RepID=A0A975U532_9PROT|nr:division/cell wall cluster transcriptional repressor MraZ [Elioraea tepida]QXM25548.1 division/cell wall cluster transcriptional repressor MraZ [Elioraea tepida]